MIKEDLIGYQWALDVIEGRFIANKWVKLECQRYVNRLSGTHKDCELIEFDFKEASIIYKLLNAMNYATGFHVGKPIAKQMVGFQAMLWENIFCWFYRSNDEFGNRRRVVEEVVLECGRKSSKSFTAGVTQILIMLRSAKFAQTATAGKTRDISKLVKQSMVEIIKASPLIEKHFKITRDEIKCTLNDCTMKSLSGEANNINGLLLSSFIVDEVANMESADVIGALKLSQMSTLTRLAIYISTQYDVIHNVFNEMLDYHKKVLIDEDVINTFSLMFELDDGDDFNNSDLWIKASPLQMTIQNGIDFLMGEYNKGLTVPSAMKEFRIKILNERIGGYVGEKYIDYECWKKCEIDDFDERVKGKMVVVGVDASLTTDLTAIVIGFRDDDGKYYFKTHCFLPEESLKVRQEKIDYRLMESLGYCTIQKGMIVDYELLEEYIRAIPEMYNCTIECIASDAYNIVTTMNSLGKDFDVILVPQNYSSLSPSIKQFQAEVYRQNVGYQKNHLYDFCMANTEIVIGRTTGDWLLNKTNKNKSRIDPIVATIFGFKQIFIEKEVYNASQMLDLMNW